MWKNISVLPGDDVTDVIEEFSKHPKLGPGLVHQKDKVVVRKSGQLVSAKKDTFWVNYKQRRYVATKGDNVVGVVTSKLGDYFRVNIGCSDQAIIHNLSFEGASKKNRPKILIGDLIFGKVIVADKNVEPEITCVIQANGKNKCMGVIHPPPESFSFSFKVSINHARRLLSDDCCLVNELGSRFQFEVIIGHNGHIYVASQTIHIVDCIMRLIKASEDLSNQQIKVLISKAV